MDIVAEVDRYMAKPYRVELLPDDDGWVARIPDLAGCLSQGDTIEEALGMIRDAQRGWLTVSLEEGLPIPEPAALPDGTANTRPSGKFIVRVPRSLHRQLLATADAEGVSLNLFATSVLARAVGATALRKGRRAVRAKSDHVVDQRSDLFIEDRDEGRSR